MNFLQRCTDYVFKQHSITELKDICVVLPTRRAVFYFKMYLGKLSEVPFLAPKVYAIDDFVMEMSGVRRIDRVSLVFELFETFKEFDSNIEFDRFIAWASALLSDFDTIDQYLVENPKSLFEYMSEAEALSRWRLDIPDNPIDHQISASASKYFQLFSNINHVYHALRSRLMNSGLAYRGMSYRLLAEELNRLILEDSAFSKFYFIGFNALSKSEERIIETLVKAKKAEVLWDTDDYYMQPKYEHRAGKFLRRYKMEGKFGKWNWQGNDLLTTAKNIKIIGVENASLQAKIAGYLYTQDLKNEVKYSTAMVLADESLLHPLMYSLDENVVDFNITMGLSLRYSMLFTLIDTIFELQQNIAEFKSKTGETYKIPKFSHRHIAKILNHPFIRRYELLKYQSKDGTVSGGVIRQALRTITQNNLVYLSEEDMLKLGENEPLFKVLFTRWNDDAKKSLKAFEELIDLLRSVYKESKDAIETEYLYLFLTILNRLEKVINQQKDFKIRTFKHFLYEMIRQERIPFSGEPVADLQITSLLETRCLDFDKVIILSTNEGMIPLSNKNHSLIPFDARREYHLPIHSDEDAIMSYHFFRLLQRAKEIDILYVLPNGEGVGGGSEKSRFIMQIENELVKINKLIKINYLKISYNESADVEQSSRIEIQKNEVILNAVSKHLAEKGIFPSHLSQYLKCSLQFYFNKIANVSKKEEIEEKFGADIFGNWLHKTLEDIDNDYKPIISEENANKILTEIPARLQQAYQDEFGGYVIDSGMNFLLKQVAEQILQEYFKFHIENRTFPLEVLSAEQNLAVSFDKEIFGKIQKIKIAGRVDRIERHESQKVLKVVDYKTGMVRQGDLKPDNGQTITEALQDPDKEKLRQLWLYQYLMLKSMTTDKGLNLGNEKLENYDVKAKIYSFRNIKENLEVDIEFVDNQSISDFIASSESLLGDFATDLLNPEKPFTQTDDLKVCERCDFKGICGR